jgi:hypothetical protein
MFLERRAKAGKNGRSHHIRGSESAMTVSTPGRSGAARAGPANRPRLARENVHNSNYRDEILLALGLMHSTAT